MNIESLRQQLELLMQNMLEWSTSPQFYSQAGIILLAVIIAFAMDWVFTQTIPILKNEPDLADCSHYENRSITLVILLSPY